MGVHRDPVGAATGRSEGKGKRRRSQGRDAEGPAEVAKRHDQPFAGQEAEWLARLTDDPGSSAAIEREVHDRARRQADLYLAELRAKARERPDNAGRAAAVPAGAEIPHRSVENQAARWWTTIWARFRSRI
jgi:hypothetical protein